jgi:hypothetical protein
MAPQRSAARPSREVSLALEPRPCPRDFGHALVIEADASGDLRSACGALGTAWLGGTLAKTSLSLSQAQDALGTARVDGFDPTLHLYTQPDAHTAAMAALAKHALARIDADVEHAEAWAVIASRALLEVTASDGGKSAKKSAVLAGRFRTPEVRRAAAGALAIGAYFQGKLYRDAARAYAEILESAPDDLAAWTMLARCTRRAFEIGVSPKVSRAELEALTARLPDAMLDHPLASAERALLRDAIDAPDATEALDAADRVLEGSARRFEVQTAIARRLVETDGRARARALVRAEPAVATGMALHAERLGRWDLLLEALDDLPLTDVVGRAVATAYRQRAKHAELIERTRALGDDAPTAVVYARARAQFLIGALVDACETSAVALRGDATHAPSHALRCRARYELGDLARAKADCEQSLAVLAPYPGMRRPEDIVHTLAAVEHDLGSHERAKELLHEALVLGYAPARDALKSWYRIDA